MPDMARKIGKMMAEFRGATSEFKETWQREINFEEETKALNLDAIEAEPVARVEAISAPETSDTVDAPAIKQIDPSSFDPKLIAEPAKAEAPSAAPNANDKQNWL